MRIVSRPQLDRKINIHTVMFFATFFLPHATDSFPFFRQSNIFFPGVSPSLFNDTNASFNPLLSNSSGVLANSGGMKSSSNNASRYFSRSSGDDHPLPCSMAIEMALERRASVSSGPSGESADSASHFSFVDLNLSMRSFLAASSLDTAIMLFLVVVQTSWNQSSTAIMIRQVYQISSAPGVCLGVMIL